jgi:ligand-binding SRPBCC domain-containing protein
MPNHLKVRILNAPHYVKPGDSVHLWCSLYGLPFYWKATVTEYEQDLSFVDCMNHGPFAMWRHSHFFESRNGGTLMTDRIEYMLPFSFFGEMAYHLFVKNELERIFTVRHKKALKSLGDKMNET